MAIDPRAFSRRDILAGLSATALAGCGKSQPKPVVYDDSPMPAAALKTLRDLGNQKQVQFIDSDGNPVNLAGLQSQIGQRYTTLSFMFAACGDTCPITASALSTVSADHPGLRHVVVSVDPLGDFTNKHLHDLLQAQGLNVDGPNRNTFILYPTVDGTGKEVSLLEGKLRSADLQHEFELMTHGNDPTKHNATVTLFGPRGDMLAQVLEGPEAIVQHLESHLPQKDNQR